MRTPRTVQDLVHQRGQLSPRALALLGIGGQALTFGDLARRVDRLAGQLAACGIHQGRGELAPVAIVLPDGPPMVHTFLATAGLAAAAPLNPAYRRAEFDFFLTDLRAQALITLAGFDTAARQSAHGLGIPVLDLVEDGTLAGAIGTGGAPPLPGEHEAALVLHTSGTTARPKLVPLTHANLVTSARAIADWLQLGPPDRCLSIMPLFHIHGLVGAVLASLAGSASLVATPGFDASRFFDWLAACRPTWYTAVPAIHQAIVQRAESYREVIRNCPLRFIRSSSSALPPSLLARLEEEFGAPVLEAYGMTEAAHQMACNPLPPGVRKPGSVGRPAGPQVAILGEELPEFLPACARGEIAIRGPSVTHGYHENPEANRRSFVSVAHGGGEPSGGAPWFRTGDQGYLDDEGYLFITGRLKEMINRGGEKIAPREVDEALLGHPEVVQAVAFAMPDPQLGEEVAAAVVLRDPGSGVTPLALRTFAAQRLAHFKVPRYIVFLDEIPKGPTGKPQRIGLADRLVDALAAARHQPAGEPNRELAQRVAARLGMLWRDVLGVAEVGLQQSFQDAGGDSLLAARLMTAVEFSFSQPEWVNGSAVHDLPPLTLLELFEAETIAGQTQVIVAWLSRS